MKLISTTPETEAFLKEWESDNDYVIAHTSGSTGKPKEIKLLKSDMVASAEATNRFFNINSGSRLVCPLSASYIAGKMMIVRALAADAQLEMLQPSNDFSLKGEISLLPIVPSQIDCLVAQDWRNISVENVIVGGAPVNPSMEQSLSALPANCYATYGMTETCSHVALRRIGTPVYEALPGITFSVDEDSRLKLTLEKFSVRELLTNDIVEIVTPHSFRWLGRFDNVVNSGGIKLFPEEIERELSQYVRGDFYLSGKPDRKWGERLVMYIKPDTEIDTGAIRSHIDHKKVPKEIIVVQEFEYTPNGKIKRK